MRKVIPLLLLLCAFATYSYAQNVGVGNTAPASKLDVSGDLALREGTPITVTAGANALTLPTAKNSVYRLTGASGAFSITSISGGNDGMMLTLINATGQTMTVSNGTIQTNTGADLVASGTVSSANLLYNATLGKWIVISGEGFSSTTTNIYNSDGTLTGNRTVTQGANNLTFNSSSGNFNYTTNTGNVMMGNGLTVSGSNNLVSGNGNTATGTYSTVSGISNRDYGTDDVIGGINNVIVTGYGHSLIVGNSDSLYGSAGAVFGYLSKVTAFEGFAQGDRNTASGQAAAVFGSSNVSSNSNTFVTGYTNTGSGSSAFVSGTGNTASGNNSSSFGSGNTAASYAEQVTGMNATTYTPSSTTGYFATDRVFDVGNGLSSSARSDAFTILKNGNVGIGNNSPSSKLTVNGTTSTTNFQMTSGGASGYVLQSDASGNGTWVNASTLASNAWGLTGNSGTVLGTNFIGNTDNKTLEFRVNNTRSGYIERAGGNNNTGFGYQTLYANTGSNNTAIGQNALGTNTTGSDNTAMGDGALYANTTASFNTAVGWLAQNSGTTANNNVSVGHYTLHNDSTGVGNVVVGANALPNNYNGSNNTVVGYNSGNTNQGSGNVFLGNQAGSNEAGSNKLYISNSSTATPLLYGDFTNKHLTVNDSLTTQYLQVTSGATSGYVLQSDANGHGTWVSPSSISATNIYNSDGTLTGNRTVTMGADNLTLNSTTGTLTFNSSSGGDIALGQGNTSTGTNSSVAVGNSNTASGSSSFTAGNSNTASGANAIALGQFVKASGQNSVAIGISSTANNNNTIAIGDQSVASGSAALAIGRQDTASGSNTFAAGTGSKAFSYNEIALGSFNTNYTPASTTTWNTADRLLSIGNGSAANAHSDALTILKSGNVGIGTNTPAYTLQVAGTTSTTNLQMTSGATNGYVLQSDASGNGTWVNPSSLSTSAWSLSGNSGTTPSNFLGTTDANQLRFKTNNNLVGFLPLNGGDNLLFGYGLGSPTGGSNVTLGNNSGGTTSSGNGNVALGSSALRYNTTGSYNVAVGYQVNPSNNTGSYNIAMGYQSMLNNTAGSNNISLGQSALYNSTGSYNVAIGQNAGGSALGNSNVFLGNGAGQSETGSNKLYISNTGTTTPLIYGDFTNQHLTVNDSLTSQYFQMTNGGTSGYVLQSDASGNGTWVNPSSITTGTTNTLANSTNTITSTVNGVAATAPAVNTVSNTSSANNLSTTVNGVAGSNVNIVNSNALSVSGTSLTSTINGVASNGLDLSSLDNNIYNSDGSLTGSRTVTMGSSSLTFNTAFGNLIFNPSSGYGYVGIGTTAPASLLSSTSGNILGSDNQGVAAGSITWAINANGYTAALYNAQSAAPANGLAVKIAGTAANNTLLDLSTGSSQASPGTTVMHVRGDGNVGIGTYSPQQMLSVNAGMNIDQAGANTGTVSSNALTFGNGSGEGIASNRNSGANQNGLDFYTDYINRLAITNSGNVGIGTTSPGSTLTVNGKTATTNFQMTNGGTSGYVLQSDASGNGTWVSPSSASTNIYNSDGTLTGNRTVTMGGDYLNFTGGNVGIGATNPLYLFTVGTPMLINMTPEASINTTGNQPLFIAETTTNKGVIIGYSGNDIQGRSGSNFQNNDILVLNQYGGNVGIGTTTPGSTLTVNGTTSTTNFQMTNGGTSGYVLQSDASGNGTWVNPTSLSSSYWTLSGSNLYNNSGTNVGIGTTSPANPLQVATGSGQYTTALSILPSTYSGGSQRSALELDNWYILQDIVGNGTKDFSIYQGSTGSHIININTSGNVGIGTITPGSTLTVNGTTSTTNFQMTNGGTSGYVLQSDASGNASWVNPTSITTGTTVSNTVSGNTISTTVNSTTGTAVTVPNIYTSDGTLAGNRTVTQGADNLTFSSTTGNLVYSTTSGNVSLGNNNTASGGNSVAIGSGNTANAVYAVAGGFANTASGQYSMAMGSNSTASGKGAFTNGYGLTAASYYETALGTSNTAYTPTSTTTWSATDRLFGVGNGINPASPSDALVILKNGNTGIGYSSPTSKLQVNGTTSTTNLQMTNGATAGYILKSDASGNASWVNPTSITTGTTNTATWTQSGGLTSTVNSVAANVTPASGTITNVLGYNSSGAPVYQAISGLAESVSNTISGNTISTTVDGTTGTAVTVPNMYTANGTLTTARTVTMGADNLTFSSTTGDLIFNPSSTGFMGLTTASPISLLANTATNIIGQDGNGINSPSLAWAMSTNGYVGALYNGSTASNANVLAIKGAGTAQTNRLLDISTGSAQATAGTSVMVALGNGTVGIGTTTPTGTLGFPNTGSNIAWGSGTSGPFTSIYDNGNIHVWTDDVSNYESGATGTTAVFNWNAGVSATGTGGTTWMKLINGLLGIGTGASTPGNTLTVNGSGGFWNSNQVNFYTDAGVTNHGFVGEYGSGSDFSIAAVTSGNWMRIGSNNANIAFFPDNTITSGANPKVVISSAGYIGVGTTSPAVPVDIQASVPFNEGSYGWLNSAGNTSTASCASCNVSLRATQRVMGVEFDATSDRRIKKNIEPISTQSALDMALSLPLIHYQYIDQFSKGSATKSGFIAQEVEKTMPDAVVTSVDYIPSIYAPSASVALDGHTLTITTAKPHGLAAGDEVKMYDKTNRAYIVKVAAINSPTEFRIDQWNEGAQEAFFVYGKKVPDLHSVDFDQITAVAIGAVQELNKKTKTLEQENNELRAMNEKLRQSMEQLKTSDSEQSSLIKTMKAQIDAINEKLNITSDK